MVAGLSFLAELLHVPRVVLAFTPDIDGAHYQYGINRRLIAAMLIDAWRKLRAGL